MVLPSLSFNYWSEFLIIRMFQLPPFTDPPLFLDFHQSALGLLSQQQSPHNYIPEGSLVLWVVMLDMSVV